MKKALKKTLKDFCIVLLGLAVLFILIGIILSVVFLGQTLFNTPLSQWAFYIITYLVVTFIYLIITNLLSEKKERQQNEV